MDKPITDNELKRNGEGYPDPTAYQAIKNIELETKRYKRLIGCILRICELSDFKLEGQIQLQDLRTGRIWNGGKRP